MSPFIVTHERRSDGAYDDARYMWSVSSRLAVATLERAQGRALIGARASGYGNGVDDALEDWVERSITEAGGTIALPDGGRVTVERVTWSTFIDNHGSHMGDDEPGPGQKTELLAAWNREHGHRGES